MAHISDVFDIDKTVEKYGNKIFLISGVGSGKSTWVKDVLSKKGRVLFITSRKAKVLEDTHCSCFSETFKWHTSDNQTLITNAKLAKLVERISEDYQKDLDDFIEMFDYIVVDEVHSIATDSTFAKYCPSVLSFIEYVANKGKIIVTMTGTPEPIEGYFKEKHWHIIDYRNRCVYIHPRKIVLTSKKAIFSKVKDNWNVNKMIYFANSTGAMIELCNKLLEEDNIQPEEIGLIVSKGREKEFGEKLAKKISQKRYEIIKKTSDEIYQNIVEHNSIPDQCKILFSTSTLKEGIDIKNDNLVMFCENHILSNLIQFFGRARGYNSTVYVIEDVADHTVQNLETLYNYGCDEEVKAANAFYNNVIKNSVFSEIEKLELIGHIQDNPYIYFDYIENRFRIFSIRFYEEKRVMNNFSWKADLLHHCEKYNISYFGCQDMKGLMTEALQIMCDRKMEIPIEQKETILNALKWAFKITDEKPININKKLAEEKLPYRLLNGKWNSGEKRNKSYWKFISVEEYDMQMAKKKKQCE